MIPSPLPTAGSAAPARGRGDPPPATRPRPGRGALEFVAVAAWAGLAAGLVELVPLVARVHLENGGLFRKSPHVLWMAPVANLLLFAAAGAALAVLVRPIPRFGRGLAALAVGTLAVLAPLLAIPGLRAAAALMLAAGVACWVVPALRARPRGFGRLIRASTPALVLLVLGIGAYAPGRSWLARRAGAPVGPAPTGAPNVLLIVMDTVRADATSLHGAGRDTTPNLAALARRGARFERAVATAPWTLPSHASLFTGRWAWELDAGPDRPLDDFYPTLAEYLARRGYDTAGFVGNVTFCSEEYGLARGFGHYEDHVVTPDEVLRSSALGWLVARRLGAAWDRLHEALGHAPGHPLEGDFHRKDAAAINRAALSWIDARGDRPFFAFLNYFDVHDPYLVPPDAATGRRAPATVAERRFLRDWITGTPRPRTPEEIGRARGAYDDCLAYLDDQIGRLLEALERRGLLDHTVVLVTSDHGEHFGEHERDGFPLAGHRLSVYQAEVHVPLVLYAPGRVPAGSVVRQAVSLRDVPATVVDLLGLDDGSPFPGASLTRRRDPAAAEDGPGAAALSEYTPSIDLPAALQDGTEACRAMKAVVSSDSSYHLHGDGREALYDLRDDPLETHDLAAGGEPHPLLGPSRDALRRLAPPASDPDPSSR